jgi:L-rhamnose-H+ transport protein
MIALGVFLHALGGFAAGSFYIPLKQVKTWGWESAWLVNGVFSWIIMPWLIAFLTVPHLFEILGEAPPSNLLWCYLFGVLWGIGGLTFGLSMRYLGMSLGYAIALGLCAVFGTLIPPVYDGRFPELIQSSSGCTMLIGVLICLFGIAICGRAGFAKEREVPEETKKQTIAEFHLFKGLLVALFAGVMSACMAFAFQAGKPIAARAVERGVPALWQQSAILVVCLAGGFTTNFLYCIFLNRRKKTYRDYVKAQNGSLVRNYLFSALAGITWYFQFMFYGMGTSKMGKYDFSSWTLHMAFIIIFSNLWSLYFQEWRGSSKRTIRTMVYGLMVVVLSIVIIGLGNYLKTLEG